MNFEFIQTPQQLYAGFKIKIRSSEKDRNSYVEIPQLWQKVLQQLMQHPLRKGLERYAIITGDLPHGRQPEAYYYALIAVESRVTDIQDLEHFELPASKMVSFQYSGPPTEVSKLTGEVFFNWLPSSGQSLAQNLEVFVYPQAYNRNDPTGTFQYCLILN